MLVNSPSIITSNIKAKAAAQGRAEVMTTPKTREKRAPCEPRRPFACSSGHRLHTHTPKADPFAARRLPVWLPVWLPIDGRDPPRAQPTAAEIREVNQRITEYARSYVTLQADGSEDDLSYIKLIDYGKKVVANRMHVRRPRTSRTAAHPGRLTQGGTPRAAHPGLTRGSLRVVHFHTPVNSPTRATPLLGF